MYFAVLVPYKFLQVKKRSLGRANLLRRNNSRAFEDGVEMVGGQAAEPFDGTGGPANFDRINLGSGSAAEVEAKLAVEDVTAATADFVGLCDASCRNGDASAESE